MKQVFKILGLLLVMVLGVVIARTLMHTPIEPAETIDEVNLDVDSKLAAEHLAQAIQFATVSNQNPALKDQQAFENFISWVANTYPELHAKLSLQRLNDTLLYKWQGSEDELQPILITGHYDVVPVIPGTEDLWQHAPFSGDISEGVIWGRGALDDKSAVVGLLEATTYLIQQGYSPKRSIYLSFGHDEELGGPTGAGAVAATLKKENVQLAWSLDEGSFLFDKMFPGLDPLVATINVAEKGSVTLQIVGKSTGGHSSMPPQETAVGILAEAILKLQNHPVPGGLEGLSLQMLDTMSRYMDFMPRVFFANQWLFSSVLEKQLSKQTFTNAMLRTTTAPTMLSASIKTNVLPIEAIATVNFRVHPRDTVQSVVDYVKSVVETDAVEVRVPTGGGRGASRVSSWSSDGYQIIENSIRETYGEVVITPGLMIAGSDSRHYGKVADDAYRFNPFIVGPDDLTGFHGTNEKMRVDNFAHGIRTYIQILKNGSSH